MRRMVWLALITAAGCAGGYSDGAVVYGGGGAYYGDGTQVQGDFYTQLSPYGQWMQTPYGQAWRPSVGGDFVPYASNGQWVSTDYGWSFDSSYPWGQVAFHYGNWYQDPSYGWVWYPSDRWAPAQVDWRYGNGYVGWTPLPPPAIRGRVVYQPNNYLYVDTPHFVEPGVGRYVRRDVNMYQRTAPSMNPVNVRGSTYNSGPRVEHVESLAGRPVPRRSIQPPSRDVQPVRGVDQRQRPRQQQPTYVPQPGQQNRPQPQAQPGHNQRVQPQPVRPEQRNEGRNPPRPPEKKQKAQPQQQQQPSGTTVHDHTHD